MKHAKLVTLVALAFAVIGFSTMAQKDPTKEKTMFTLGVARSTDNLPEVTKFQWDSKC